MSRVKQVTFTWLIFSMRCSFLFLRIKKRDRQRFYAHMSYASHMYLVSIPPDSGNVLFSCHIFQTSDNGCYSCVDSCIHTTLLDILKEIYQIHTTMEPFFFGGGGCCQLLFLFALFANKKNLYTQWQIKVVKLKQKCKW